MGIGLIQGGVLEPKLWNIGYEEALNKLKDIHDDSTEKTDSKETPEEEETEE